MRQFLKFTLASLTGSLLFFLILVAVSALGAVGLVGVLVAGFSSEETPAVEKDSILVYDLSTIIPDIEDIPSPTEVLLQGQVPNQVTLRQAVTAIRAAAQDKRIAGLYLKGSNAGIGAGLAAQMELRQAISEFREAGKPVIAYDVSWSEREYLLASLANTVYMNPFGELEMNGLFAQTMYQAEALNKLGIGVQVTRVGKYKSAVEPLIRNDMSPEEEEQTRRLLNDLWQTIITDSAQDRPINPAQFQATADNQGFLFGDEAKTQNYVDTIAYEDEVIAQLRSMTGEADDQDSENFRQISLGQYASVAEDKLQTRNAKDEVAVVYAEGPIIDGDGSGLSDAEAIAGDRLAQQLRELRRDDSVKAVVLRVNSPGGSATASEIILREVRLLQEAGKPVVVSMGNVAASGGYWISSLADTIVAEPTTITGSIGVFSLFVNLEDLGDKIGINWDGVKTADLADIYSSTRPKNEKELAILQKSVDHVYDEFLQRVVEGRNLPQEKVAEIAQGRVWSGKTAKDLGLVDELGGLDQAIEIAAQKAELGDDWKLKEYPEGDEWQRFFGLLGQAETATKSDPLTAQLNKLMDDVALLKLLNDPQGMYALMPFEIDVN